MRWEWHLGTILVLGPLPGALPCAPLRARLGAAERGLEHLGEIAGLLMSELAINPVRMPTQMLHGRKPDADVQRRRSGSLPWYRAQGRYRPSSKMRLPVGERT